MKKSNGLGLIVFMIMLIFSSNSHAALVISELDCDNEGTDSAEFVEILNTGPEAYDFSQDPVVLVFFNGADDESYRAVDLTGKLSAGGIMVVGGPDVNPVPQMVMSANFIQNGADAVALYSGDASQWANGTAAAAGYMDALVYDTDDEDDTGLLSVFDVLTGLQVNENNNGQKDYDSIQRIDLGLGGSHFVVGAATPGESTLVPLPSALFLLSSGLMAMVAVKARSKERCLTRPRQSYSYR